MANLVVFRDVPSSSTPGRARKSVLSKPCKAIVRTQQTRSARRKNRHVSLHPRGSRKVVRLQCADDDSESGESCESARSTDSCQKYGAKRAHARTSACAAALAPRRSDLVPAEQHYADQENTPPPDPPAAKPVSMCRPRIRSASTAPSGICPHCSKAKTCPQNSPSSDKCSWTANLARYRQYGS